MFDVAALTRHWKTAPPFHIAISNLIRAVGIGRALPSGPPQQQQPSTKSMSDAEMAQQKSFLESVAGQFGNIGNGAIAR